MKLRTQLLTSLVLTTVSMGMVLESLMGPELSFLDNGKEQQAIRIR